MIATGARYRRLDVPRLEEFEGTSVYYAATPMEAQLCRGDPVAVVGGGNSAGQAALFLAEHAARVRLLVRDDDLAAGHVALPGRPDRANAERGGPAPHRGPRAGRGRILEALIVEDNRTGERRTLEARALFVFIGAEPCTPGSGTSSRSTTVASSSPGAMPLALRKWHARRGRPRRTCSRPASPACSRRET